MPHLIGQTIGQYRVIEQIGRGGMATVYKAFQPSMERYVALKVLPPHFAQDSTYLERFRREARAIAQLEHPHILPVYDYGEVEGLTYMVMRYLDSGTLTKRLKQPIEVAEVARLLGQVAEALDYTHSQGITHRDIKPSNILLDPRGAALLTDFGIAKIVEGTQGITQEGLIGTPKYMSPEQAQGRPVDGRSDIYSLGIILYEALVGRPPFEAETPVAVLLKHVHDPLPLPRSIEPAISQAMEQVILKALAKAPADRYQTAGEMERAMHAALVSAGQSLTQFSSTPVAVPVPTSPPTAPAAPSPIDNSVKAQTNRLPVIIGGSLLALLGGILLIGGAMFGYFQSGDSPKSTVTETTAIDEVNVSGPIEPPTISPEIALLTEATEIPTSAAEESTVEDTVSAAVTQTPTPTPNNTPAPAEPTATSILVATVAPALPPAPTPVVTLVAVNVTGNPGRSDAPSLAVDRNGILHLAWWDNSVGKDDNILHRQRTPDGAWSEAEILTADFNHIFFDGDSSLGLIRNPSNGQVCIFFRGGNLARPETFGLYRRCQAENGWSSAEMIVQSRGNMRDFNPIFAPDGSAHTSYIINAGDLYFGDFELSDGFKNAYKPDLAIDQAGGYHAVWVRQGDPFSIEYRYSADGGQTWQEAERLTDENISVGGVLRLTADEQGNVHLVFVSPFRGIFYRRWTFTGGWEPAVELTQGERNSSSASLGLTTDLQGLAHVVWQGSGVYYVQQLPDDTWSKPRLIANALNTGPGPAVAVDAQGSRHFVWQVEDDALDLYYARLP